MKKMKITVCVSSVTGNTKKVVDYMMADVNSYGQVTFYETKDVLRQSQLPEADLYVIAFWCRRGSMDDYSLILLDRLQNEKIILLGTLGNYPDSDYGTRVYNRVCDLVEEKNHLLGCFLCQGKIEESRTEKRRNLPPDHRHYLNDVGYQRHLDSRSHPDENDLKNALKYVTSILEELG